MDRNAFVPAIRVTGDYVALRKESVDRNICSQAMRVLPLVALRKESVDRNNRVSGLKRCNNVALRKESVDRNG